MGGEKNQGQEELEDKRSLLKLISLFSFPIANKASRKKAFRERMPNLFVELAVLPL